MFDTVLIANRGEIAVRIIRTLHRLGLTAVAVYSDVDAGAPHVRAADTAARLGPSAPADSYLHAGRVLAAARATGAQAVHPGYGFLAENPAFARACAEAGLTFIGPPASAIEAMADKARARRLMAEAGVPVVPGADDGDLDDDALVELARGIGLPVMVKPVAGGGGKGMAVVAADADLRPAMAAARRQARAAFGDDRLLVERFVPRPRHIEVQVLADAYGAAVHLGERECSLQRRHQKIVEEAPSPLLDAATRARIGASAVAAARACAYVGAGTVEYIVSHADPGTFFFLEMNTRLQVEHPVTEMVTGIDLVEWQVRIAAGESLALTQDAVPSRGHAVEARVYAEDPSREFLPTGGTVAVYEAPAAPGVRVDAGIAAGTVVPTVYDPLLAKVVAHGGDRAEALRRLDRALGELTVLGVGTNAGFLRRLLHDGDVRAGTLDTGLVGRRLTALTPGPAPDHALIVAALHHLATLERTGGTGDVVRGSRTSARSVFDQPGGWRIGDPAWTVLRLRGAGTAATVRIRGTAREADVAVGEVDPVRVRARTDGAVWRVEVAGRHRRYRVAEQGDVIWVGAAGDAWALRREERLEAARHAHAPAGGPVPAPMPGSVVAVEAREGEQVSTGQVLAVIEAMKMEHQVVAPVDGVVKDIAVRPGDQVDIEQVLLVVEPSGGTGRSDGRHRTDEWTEAPDAG